MRDADPRAYYNEVDPHAAQWLRNLIDAGHIAAGDVDERDIQDVTPADLDGYTQCHFFAGIGIWSHGLRAAGWRDDQPVWTGSCPCQPFSAAGKGDGFDDERHLWPAWHWLIEQCRPETVFGEQVASRDGLTWLDLVSADMEATEYAIGAVDTCAAGFGAPHIRQRLYFAAHDLRPAASGLGDGAGARSLPRTHRRIRGYEESGRPRDAEPERSGAARGMVNRQRAGLEGHSGHGDQRRESGRLDARTDRPVTETGPTCGMADACCQSCEWDTRAISGPKEASSGERHSNGGHDFGHQHGGDVERLADASGDGRGKECADIRWSGSGDSAQGWAAGLGSGRASQRLANAHGGNTCPERQQPGGQHRCFAPNGGDGDGCDRPGPTNGLWRDADWLFCRDGSWRPVGPGTFPLAHGAAARMGRLRAYGNGLCAAQAAGFINAYLTRDLATLDAEPAGDLFEWGLGS